MSPALLRTGRSSRAGSPPESPTAWSTPRRWTCTRRRSGTGGERDLPAALLRETRAAGDRLPAVAAGLPHHPRGPLLALRPRHRRAEAPEGAVAQEPAAAVAAVRMTRL